MIHRDDTRTVRCQGCGGLTVPPSGPATDIRVLALRALAQDIGGCHDDTWRFFRTLIEAEEPYRSVKALAYDLGVNFSSLTSRFHRLQMPNARRYVTYVQLMRVAAARVGSLVDAAALLDYSSAQSVGRTIATAFGIKGTEFLARETGESMLERLRQDLVLPYREQWLKIRMLPEIAPTGPKLSRVA